MEEWGWELAAVDEATNIDASETKFINPVLYLAPGQILMLKRNWCKCDETIWVDVADFSKSLILDLNYRFGSYIF